MTLAVGGGGSKLVVGGIRLGGSKGSGQVVSHRVVETKCNALIKNEFKVPSLPIFYITYHLSSVT